jgi:hypothetical protein
MHLIESRIDMACCSTSSASVTHEFKLDPIGFVIRDFHASDFLDVTDKRPSRSVALSEVDRRSTKASQSADQCAALDVGT